MRAVYTLLALSSMRFLYVYIHVALSLCMRDVYCSDVRSPQRKVKGAEMLSLTRISKNFGPTGTHCEILGNMSTVNSRLLMRIKWILL